MAQLGKLDKCQEDFSVWGGKLKPEQWHAFLSAWQWPDDKKRWRILEFVSDFKIEDGAKPLAKECIPLLERAELFGESGHLSTRRDGETIHWHFVGKTTIVVPEGYDEAKNNYWTTHADEKFRRSEKENHTEKENHMLLWGERVANTARWHDDRVAWAELEYPLVSLPTAVKPENHLAVSEQKKQRVQANYWQFTRAGQVAFVWLTGLTEYQAKETSNG